MKQERNSRVRWSAWLGALFEPSEVGLPLISRYWHQARDGDPVGLALFQRHYSRKRYADGRLPMLFVGPGEKTVLLTSSGDALFVWRKFRSGDGQKGVNCAVFRNEGPLLSSALILDAEGVAWKRWPGARLYTYVNPRRVRSVNPGCCFERAGWKRCGETRWNKLLIYEKRAEAPNE